MRKQYGVKNPFLQRDLAIAFIENIKGYYGTLWTEAYWEILETPNDSVGFIISDNPITVYNNDCCPCSKECIFPNDPNPEYIGSQTIFPLSKSKCLILTNKEFITLKGKYPKKRRTNMDPYRTAIFNFMTIDRGRKITVDDVIRINFILKKRAHAFIASDNKDLLYPERVVKNTNWEENGAVLKPNPKYNIESELIYVKYSDGHSITRDYLGRVN